MYSNYFPPKSSSCKCRHFKHSRAFGLHYEGQIRAGLYGEIPCFVNDCNTDPRSFVVSGGLAVDSWFMLPRFDSMLDLNIRGYSSSRLSELLVQLRVSADQADSGVNFGVTQKHFHPGHKAFLAVLDAGHIPALTNYLAMLPNNTMNVGDVVWNSKHWSSVFHSDHWSHV